MPGTVTREPSGSATLSEPSDRSLWLTFSISRPPGSVASFDGYELAIRHATRLPTVLISRTAERVPFDIADLRVVRLKMTDIYTFVPQMEAWRAELTQRNGSAA